MGFVTCDRWQVARTLRHLTPDTWLMTCNNVTITTLFIEQLWLHQGCYYDFLSILVLPRLKYIIDMTFDADSLTQCWGAPWWLRKSKYFCQNFLNFFCFWIFCWPSSLLDPSWLIQCANSQIRSLLEALGISLVYKSSSTVQCVQRATYM